MLDAASRVVLIGTTQDESVLLRSLHRSNRADVACPHGGNRSLTAWSSVATGGSTPAMGSVCSHREVVQQVADRQRPLREDHVVKLQHHPGSANPQRSVRLIDGRNDRKHVLRQCTCLRFNDRTKRQECDDERDSVQLIQGIQTTVRARVPGGRGAVWFTAGPCCGWRCRTG